MGDNLTNYIAHAGTKGMTWGHRRWQNEDGTWTEDGKARRRAQYNSSRAYGEAQDMTDEELRTINARYAQEDLYRKNVERDYDAYTREAREYATEMDKLRKSVEDSANKFLTKDIPGVVTELDKKKARIAKGKLYDATKSLSDEELKRFSDRMSLEQRYMDLKSKDVRPSSKRSAGEIIALVTAVGATAVTALNLADSVLTIIEKKRGS